LVLWYFNLRQHPFNFSIIHAWTYLRANISPFELMDNFKTRHR
jgi:hypothetical protein